MTHGRTWVSVSVKSANAPVVRILKRRANIGNINLKNHKTTFIGKDYDTIYVTILKDSKTIGIFDQSGFVNKKKQDVCYLLDLMIMGFPSFGRDR